MQNKIKSRWGNNVATKHGKPRRMRIYGPSFERSHRETYIYNFIKWHARAQYLAKMKGITGVLLLQFYYKILLFFRLPIVCKLQQIPDNSWLSVYHCALPVHSYSANLAQSCILRTDNIYTACMSIIDFFNYVEPALFPPHSNSVYSRRNYFVNCN
jgi:hypothetical protein